MTVDSYGSCLNNKQLPPTDDFSRHGSKLETMEKYKFCLAFENSNEIDYVTEKYFQSLVAGCVPVVVGAPNIADFEPSPNSILHIASMEQVPFIASEIKRINNDDAAWNEMLSWKQNGVTRQFLALIDTMVSHSSCRLCFHVIKLQRIIEDVQRRLLNPNDGRPCRCRDQTTNNVLFHIQVRERGRYAFESIFLSNTTDASFTLTQLHQAIHVHFTSLHHQPLWIRQRGQNPFSNLSSLDLYRVYPTSPTITPRDYLYGDKYFHDDEQWRQFLLTHPCPQLEVIFV